MSKTGLSGTVGGVHQAPPPERAVDEINDSATTEEQRHSSDITTTDNHQIPRAICWRLYVSHFLSTWNSRSFEFGSVLFLAHLYPDTLRYLSIYALIRSASAIITSTPLGRAIDHYARLPVVRLSIGELATTKVTLNANMATSVLIYDKSLDVYPLLSP